MTETGTTLANYDAARTALQKAHRVDEVKAIRDKAEAMRVYARQANDTEMQNWAVEIKLRAERRAGELIKEQQAAKVLDAGKGGDRKSDHRRDVATLKSLGISRDQSSRWQKLAAVPGAKFEKIVAETKDKAKELTSAAVLRVAVQGPERAARQEKIAREAKAGGQALPTGTLFPVILCDCPWKYDFTETESRAIENQYPPMPVEALCAGIFDGVDVRSLFAKDAAIFFWATAPKLREALQVLDAWGFAYVTNLCWDKLKIGMGYWARGQHEHLLIATKGSFPPPDEQSRPASVIRAERGAHSEKPKVVFRIIEKMFPTLPKLQLFGREHEDGWVTWGNQLRCRAGAATVVTRVGERRGKDVQSLLRHMKKEAGATSFLSITGTRDSYLGRGKYQRAVEMAARFPEIGWKLPPKRKLGDSEHYLMSMFEALAIAASYSIGT